MCNLVQLNFIIAFLIQFIVFLDYNFLFDKEYIGPKPHYNVDLLNQWISTSKIDEEVSQDKSSVISDKSAFSIAKTAATIDSGISDEKEGRVKTHGLEQYLTEYHNFVLDGLKAEVREIQLQVLEFSSLSEGIVRLHKSVEQFQQKEKLFDVKKSARKEDDDDELELPLLLPFHSDKAYKENEVCVMCTSHNCTGLY